MTWRRQWLSTTCLDKMGDDVFSGNVHEKARVLDAWFLGIVSGVGDG